MKDHFDDDQLLRYSRHILLPQMDLEGQLKLARARVLIVGLGGLGSPVAMYLAASGVGHLTLVDDDRVDLSNLQRQIVHREAAIGENKARSAAQALLAINSGIGLATIERRLDDAELEEQARQVDVVVDCSDNFVTRRAVNRACVTAKTPLVSGAAIRLEGQLAVFDPRQEASPCYQCLYPELPDEQLTCAESGVLAPVVGVIGSLQALEAIKLLAGIGHKSWGRLTLFDAAAGQFRQFTLAKDLACPICQKR